MFVSEHTLSVRCCIAIFYNLSIRTRSWHYFTKVLYFVKKKGERKKSDAFFVEQYIISPVLPELRVLQEFLVLQALLLFYSQLLLLLPEEEPKSSFSFYLTSLYGLFYKKIKNINKNKHNATKKHVVVMPNKGIKIKLTKTEPISAPNKSKA